MNNTKKGFITAATIIGIIEAASLIFIGLILLISFKSIDAEMILSILAAEEELILTDAEISFILSFSKIFMVIFSIYSIVMGAAMLTLSILVLKNKNKGVFKKGLAIALLVISVLNGNMLSTAFIIVALCIKDKTAAEIVEENMNK